MIVTMKAGVGAYLLIFLFLLVKLAASTYDSDDEGWYCKYTRHAWESSTFGPWGSFWSSGSSFFLFFFQFFSIFSSINFFWPGFVQVYVSSVLFPNCYFTFRRKFISSVLLWGCLIVAENCDSDAWLSGKDFLIQ